MPVAPTTKRPVIELDWDEPSPIAVPVNGTHEPESFETAKPVELPRAEVIPIDAPRRFADARTVGRTLPHSLEAEEYLLSCCLLDGADVVSRCLEAKIKPDSFYDPKHGIIFERLIDLHKRQAAIDVSVVAEELKTAHLLDQVGGYGFLAQVSSRIPTTAQAGYFIEKVREQALLREIIRSATGVVEDCYGFSGGIEEFAADVALRLQEIASGSGLRESELEKRQFNIQSTLPKPRPIFTVARTTICTPGNLTTLYSQAKTGKSSFIGAMMAATMTQNVSHDTLGVSGYNESAHAVLHFDTEQSPYDWQQLVKLTLRRAVEMAPPPWFHSYTIAGMEPREAEAFIHAAIRRAQRRHKGIHSIFIDGVADLVNDPNDPAECFPLVTRLHGLAISAATAIILILHMNPGSDVKGRGHLGSQLERKSESNLTLKKGEDGVTSLVAEGRQRGKPIPSKHAPSFQWSDEHQMHVSCGTPEAVQKSKGGRTEEYAFSIYRSLFPKKDDPGMPLTQLANRLSVNKPINAKRLYSCCARWAEEGYVAIEDTPKGKLYRMAV